MKTVEIASKNIDAAILFAKTEKRFTEIQMKLQRYYSLLDDCAKVKSGQTTKLQVVMEESFPTEGDGTAVSADLFNFLVQHYGSEQSEELCNIFKKALENGDSNTIIEIGKGIEFLRSLAGKEKDNCRADILYWKSVLDRKKEK